MTSSYLIRSDLLIYRGSFLLPYHRRASLHICASLLVLLWRLNGSLLRSWWILQRLVRKVWCQNTQEVWGFPHLFYPFPSLLLPSSCFSWVFSAELRCSLRWSSWPNLSSGLPFSCSSLADRRSLRFRSGIPSLTWRCFQGHGRIQGTCWTFQRDCRFRSPLSIFWGELRSLRCQVSCTWPRCWRCSRVQA